VQPSPGFGIGEIDETVLGKLRVQCDIEQTSLSARLDGRHVGEWLGEATVLVDTAEPPGTLGDEQAPIGEEHQSPGMLEPTGDGLDAESAVR
jgi:hypothetical protein